MFFLPFWIFTRLFAVPALPFGVPPATLGPRDRSASWRGRSVRRRGFAMTFFSHPSAYVDDGCEIGDDTKIWHFCHVQTRREDRPQLRLRAERERRRRRHLGDGVKVQNNVSIYTGTIIEDYVFLGPVVRADERHEPEIRG